MTTNFDVLDPQTTRQIAELTLTKRPLIVCDVDEVALHFVEPFERHLETGGYRLIARSYGLTGNIVRNDDGVAATQNDVRHLLLSFFERQTGNQLPVAGVSAALERLSETADVIMLSNIPAAHRQLRAETLSRHRLPYPVVTNVGPKGPAVRTLYEATGAAVFFLDDSPSNLRSVRDLVPSADLIHFIADRRFFDLADEIDGVHLKANDWPTVADYIADRLGMS